MFWYVSRYTKFYWYEVWSESIAPGNYLENQTNWTGDLKIIISKQALNRCYLFFWSYRHIYMFNYVYSGQTMSNHGMEKGFVNKDQLQDSVTKWKLYKDVIYINGHY